MNIKQNPLICHGGVYYKKYLAELESNSSAPHFTVTSLSKVYGLHQPTRKDPVQRASRQLHNDIELLCAYALKNLDIIPGCWADDGDIIIFGDVPTHTDATFPKYALIIPIAGDSGILSVAGENRALVTTPLKVGRYAIFDNWRPHSFWMDSEPGKKLGHMVALCLGLEVIVTMKTTTHKSSDAPRIAGSPKRDSKIRLANKGG